MNNEDSRMRALVYDAWETHYAPDLADRLDIEPGDELGYIRMLSTLRDLLDYELRIMRNGHGGGPSRDITKGES